MIRSPSRRQITACPSRLAQTDMMPGVGSQPKRYSSSRRECVYSEFAGENAYIVLLAMPLNRNVLSKYTISSDRSERFALKKGLTETQERSSLMLIPE